MYSTLALGEEREIVKEETALRKEKEAAFVHVYIQYIQLYASLYSFLKAVSSFTISLSFPYASVLYTYYPCSSVSVIRSSVCCGMRVCVLELHYYVL